MNDAEKLQALLDGRKRVKDRASLHTLKLSSNSLEDLERISVMHQQLGWAVEKPIYYDFWNWGKYSIKLRKDSQQ